MAAPEPPEDRVLSSTRVVAAFIIPFLVVAFFVLFPWPSDTKRLFAWQIRPRMSAMVLGAVYIGGAYFFFRVVCASQWHTVAGGFVPVGTFASLMAVTTVLHWNRFIHDRLAFWLWVGLYFTTPFIIFTVFFRNQAQCTRGSGSEVKISRIAALTMVATAVLSMSMSGFLYLFPSKAISVWPWILTPLTARMLAAIFALGIAGFAAFRERRWSAVRILLQVEGIMLGLIVVAGFRARHQFDSSCALTWLFAAGFAVAMLATGILYFRMESRSHSG